MLASSGGQDPVTQFLPRYRFSPTSPDHIYSPIDSTTPLITRPVLSPPRGYPADIGYTALSPNSHPLLPWLTGHDTNHGRDHPTKWKSNQGDAKCGKGSKLKKLLSPLVTPIMSPFRIFSRNAGPPPSSQPTKELSLLRSLSNVETTTAMNNTAVATPIGAPFPPGTFSPARPQTLTVINRSSLYNSLPPAGGDEVLRVISNCEGQDVLLPTLLKESVVQVERRLLFYFKQLKNIKYCYDIVEKIAIQDAHGITLLVQLLNTTESYEIQELVTGVFWNLSSSDTLKVAILKEALEPLVQVSFLCCPVKSAYLNVVIPQSGWKDGTDQYYATANGSISWTTVFRNATGCLKNLSSAGLEGRTMLRLTTGLVDSLLWTVRAAQGKNDIDNKAVENAVCILRNLSYRSPSHPLLLPVPIYPLLTPPSSPQIAIQDAHGITLLVQLLNTTESYEIQELVTGVFWNLSSSDTLKVAILKEALEPLVQVSFLCCPVKSAYLNVVIPQSGWKDGTDQYYATANGSISWTTVFRNATGCLKNLSSAGLEGRTMLRLTTGLVDSLLWTVRAAQGKNDIDNKAVENAVCILRNLSYRLDNEVPPEIKYGQNDDWRSRGLGGGQFRRKVEDGTGKKKGGKKSRDNVTVTPLPEHNTGVGLLWQPAVVRVYLDLLLECSNPETLEGAAGALQNLTACSWEPAQMVREVVRREKGLSVITSLLRLDNDYVVRATSLCLRNLAMDPKNKELLGKHAMQDLIRRLPGGDGADGITDITISGVISSLSELVTESQENAKLIRDLDGIYRLLEIARSSDLYTRQCVMSSNKALAVLWDYKDTRKVLKTQGWHISYYTRLHNIDKSDGMEFDERQSHFKISYSGPGVKSPDPTFDSHINVGTSFRNYSQKKRFLLIYCQSLTLSQSQTNVCTVWRRRPDLSALLRIKWDMAPPYSVCMTAPYPISFSISTTEHWPDPILASLKSRELWSEHWPDRSAPTIPIRLLLDLPCYAVYSALDASGRCESRQTRNKSSLDGVCALCTAVAPEVSQLSVSAGDNPDRSRAFMPRK
eukprot:sb/3461496/